MDQILSDVLVTAIQAVPWAGVLIIFGLLFWPRLCDLLTEWLQSGDRRWTSIAEGLARVEAALTALEISVNERASKSSADIVTLTGVLRELSDDIRALLLNTKVG